MLKKIRKVFQMFSSNIVIDLGSENTIIANYKGNQGGGNIINIQPTSVAYNSSTDEIYIGEDADKLIDKSPDFRIIKPVRNGVIVDDAVAVKLVRELTSKVVKNNIFMDLNFYISIPSASSAVDIRMFKEVLYDVGAGNVYLIDSTLATALGAGLDLSSDKTYMILNIGSDATEMGVVSMRKTIHQKTFKIGGENICNAIISIVKDVHNVSIGYKTAVRLLKGLGTFEITNENKYDVIEVQGKSLNSSDIRIAKRINVSRVEVFDAINYIFNSLLNMISDEIEGMPSDTISDIMSNGLYIAGGVSNLDGIARYFDVNVGIKTHIVNDSKMAIVNGLFKSVEMNMER